MCSDYGIGAVAASRARVGTFAQPRPLRIGASVSLTGTLAQSGDKVKRGYELWARDINGRGGLLGRPVEFVIFDDRSDAGTSARLYEKLITEDKVDMVLGPYGSAASFAALGGHGEVQVPDAPSVRGKRRDLQPRLQVIFQLFPPLSGIFDPVIGEVGDRAGYQRVAIIHSSDLYSKSVGAACEATCKKYKREIVLKEEFPIDASDLSSLMLKLRTAKPDLVVGGSQLPDSMLIVRNMKDGGCCPRRSRSVPDR